MRYRGLKVRVELVREGTSEIYGRDLSNPKEVADFVGEELRWADREHFVSILLNAKNMPLYVDEVSIGSLSNTLVHPRELFKSAILASSQSIHIQMVGPVS